MKRDVLGAFTPTEIDAEGFLTLRQANERAEQWRELLKQGIDPRRIKAEQEAKQELANAHTFLAMAQKFLSVYRPKNKPHLRPDTKKEYTRHLIVDFQSLHERPLHTITRSDVNEALDLIQQRIEGSGINNCFATIRLFLKWCAQRGYIEVPPTAAMEKR